MGSRSLRHLVLTSLWLGVASVAHAEPTTEASEERAASSTEDPRAVRAGSALLILSAAIYLGCALDAARIETPIVDEYAHLPAGCAYLVGPDGARPFASGEVFRVGDEG